MKEDLLNGPVEVWGGMECTINRVENDFFDQLAMTSTYFYDQHIDEIIGLGIKMIRFPVLWERHQPTLSQDIRWDWAERQLQKFKKNNIEPIVGLLHHGSGPAFTNLLDEKFPELFAAYAGKVAKKFPWVNHYTPINEPLTTARFSGLYGLWYPHKTNDASFIKILINELKATVLALQEIRKVNPAAKFVQTEDLAKTYSTPLLAYQATFENRRRWLTYDILTGRFNIDHPLWKYFSRLGIHSDTMQFFLDNPTSPDIIGVNYYATSERYLDERIEQYPTVCAGGNGVHNYVDVEAVRVPIREPHGLEVLLRELWSRYKLPLAITEVHLHCSREDQLRWLEETYQTANRIREDGIGILAITPWALLGSFGWNKLLTGPSFDYETGAFDVSAGYIRPTALASLIKNLALGKNHHHPFTTQKGWWSRNTRYLKPVLENYRVSQNGSHAPIVIIGKSGTLGKAFAKICSVRNIHHYLLGREESDICNTHMLEEMIAKYRPWAIINTAGYVRVDDAESDKDLCEQVNTDGAHKLAITCEKNQVKLITFSSDLVFNGVASSPYTEYDRADPLNVYGTSKAKAEVLVLEENPSALVIRTSAFFGPWDEHNFVRFLLSELNSGKVVEVAEDIIISPTYVPHLVHAALDLLIDQASGIWHLANRACLSWYEFARIVALRSGLDADLIQPVSQVQNKALRPVFSALASNRYNLMPSLDDAVEEYFEAIPQRVNIKTSILKNT